MSETGIGSPKDVPNLCQIPETRKRGSFPISDTGQDDTFGWRLKVIRWDRLRLSQQDLADRMGVTYQTVSTWENGHNQPPPKTLARLARVLGAAIEALHPGGPDPRTTPLAANFRQSVPSGGWSPARTLAELTTMAVGELSAGAMTAARLRLALDFAFTLGRFSDGGDDPPGDPPAESPAPPVRVLLGAAGATDAPPHTPGQEEKPA